MNYASYIVSLNLYGLGFLIRKIKLSHLPPRVLMRIRGGHT